MKRTFKEFYEPGKDATLESLWDSAYFSFDSSVLLELFDVPTDSRNDWLNFVGTIPPNRRWLTFQAAREYHSGVDRVIQRHLGKEQQARNVVSSAKLPSFDDLIKSKVFFSTDAKDVFDAHMAPLKKAFESWRLQVEKTVNELLNQYKVDCGDTKERIANLFDGQVGNQYSETWLKEHHDIARIRMLNQIPPGYSDSAKTGNVNGDIFLWFELIEETLKRAMPLVFVTKDQQKDDWFLKDHENKVRCARPELVNEMSERAGQTVVICTLNKFLDFASSKGEVKESTIEEFATAETKETQPHLQSLDDVHIRLTEIDIEIRDLDERIAAFDTGSLNKVEEWEQHRERTIRRVELEARRSILLDKQTELFTAEMRRRGLV